MATSENVSERNHFKRQGCQPLQKQYNEQFVLLAEKIVSCMCMCIFLWVSQNGVN